MPRMKAEKHKFLSRDEVSRLLNGPRLAKRSRDYYLLSVMYYLGLRESEAVSMKPEYLDLENHEAYIPSSKRKPKRGQAVCKKTGKPLIRVPILFGDGVLAGAKAWAGQSEWMFPSKTTKDGRLGTRQVRRTFHLWSRAADLPKQVSAHSLRHSAGTHVNEVAGGRIRKSGGDPLVLIRDFMRHSSIQTTSIYLHSTTAVVEAARYAMSRA